MRVNPAKALWREARAAASFLAQGMLGPFGATSVLPYKRRKGVSALRALVMMFALSLANPGFAADEALNRVGARVAVSLEEQTFRFTYLRMPIGEVTFLYENGMGARSREDRSMIAERTSDDVGANLTPDGVAARPDFGAIGGRELIPGNAWLMGLTGKTNGFVSWLKDYEGHYQSRPSQSSILYTVRAIDRGYEEVREIEFHSSAGRRGLPQVIAFKDRTAVDALEPDPQWDAQSLDPVNLLRTLLQDIERLRGCPADSLSYRLFDGKRRYVATLMGEEKEKRLAGSVALCVLFLSKAALEVEQLEPPGRAISRLRKEASEASALRSDLQDTNLAGYRESLDVKLGRGTTLGVSSAPSGAELFWPFNQSALRVDFEVSLEQGVARYQSFRIDSPFGKIKGSLVLE